MLTIPAGAVITKAYLYWGARTPQMAADLSAVDFIHRNGKIADAQTVQRAQAPRRLVDVEQQIQSLVRSGR